MRSEDYDDCFTNRSREIDTYLNQDNVFTEEMLKQAEEEFQKTLKFAEENNQAKVDELKQEYEMNLRGEQIEF
jgi:hypothetical protein